MFYIKRCFCVNNFSFGYHFTCDVIAPAIYFYSLWGKYNLQCVSCKCTIKVKREFQSPKRMKRICQKEAKPSSCTHSSFGGTA